MAGLSSFYAVLLLAIVARVAAQFGPVDPERAIKVPVGTKFQLSILENGKEKYLYSEGEKVLKTSNPDSVGIERTIWESVDGYAPRSLDYIDAFAIKNSDTGFTLLYDGEFYGEYNEGFPLAGWKVFQSLVFIYPPEFHLVYLPHSNGPIPGIFYYKPIDSKRSSSAARIPHQLRHSRSAVRTRGDGPDIDPLNPGIQVPVGTKFQLAIFKDGEDHYLYSEGEKVKTTTNPDSVGTKRTIWESVNGFAPLLVPYINAFAIKNTDTGFTLLYNGEFYGEYIEGLPLAGWKLYESPVRIYPQQYYLIYLPYSSSGNVIPNVFHFKRVSEGIQTVVA